VPKHQFTALITLVTLILLALVTPACYTGGRIEVRAVPPEAYVYIDGTPVADGTASGDNNVIVDDLKPGEYTVDIYDYGYAPQQHKITVAEGKTAHLGIDMVREVGPIPGPWGRIIMEGPPHAAVFLNGDTPGFLVGHVDEFDKDLGGWRGQLVVPPGNFKLSVNDQGRIVWSGPVTVAANQTVNVDVKAGGKQTTSNWAEGEKIGSLWPQKSSVFRTTVAVAPVTAQINASPVEVGCGGAARLTWSSTGAAMDTISDLGEVPASGDRQVQLKQTTTYKLIAAGPGGILSPEATVTVNPAIEGTLSVSPAEVRYHKVGEKVEEQGSATLNWSVTGADTVSIDQIGSVAANGDHAVQPTPTKTAVGPVDETVTYTLRATNACGGSTTRTASLHIGGAIESGVNIAELESKFNFDSIYFPTDQPFKSHPQGGLVSSEQSELDNVITFFKQFLEFVPDTHLILEGHADVRGSVPYNDSLTERRVDRVKGYLVNGNVPVTNVDTHAFGKRVQLSRQEVLDLTAQNPNLTPQERKRIQSRIRKYWLANNRRVDIKLGATGKQSNQFFPYSSPDAEELSTEARHAPKRAGKKHAPAKK
jgi:outer membrane protein OmpA-like peptidoglycan-associated protein